MRPREAAPVVPLSPELRTILLEGPYVLGKSLWDIPRHDELRTLWQAHAAELLAVKKRPWFLGRDEFVRMVRGER